MKITAFFLSFALLMTSAPSNATLINFIYTGSGSGSIDGVDFDNATFVITEHSNTDDITACSSTCKTLKALTTTISIEGVGFFDFITETRTFSVNGIIGFSRVLNGGLDLFNLKSSAFNFDLASSLAPITTTAELKQWSRSPVETSGGILEFKDADIFGTFEARLGGISIPTTVPGPSTLFIFALGLALLSIRRYSAKN
ncbi:PEP-CTERM sorting domain-containing protein [Thalassotalea profundi]|uniref:PEP-CTERM sorting domain-containing protein n=1 Tax=Thalassotalea profundi TaxID=2036687 RepID=A0ABQ3ISW1_9GAMM|nr:PEP-CTERM sorting domain-containing protein [Thalassotalea profundi]GHE91880.1 hypothetical protein GCM10011501_21670 [Thalassotalea profundi]